MMAFILLLFAVTSLLPSISAGCCQNGWIPYDGHCYYIGYESLLTFSEALFYCISRDAYLTRLDTYSEYSFLRNFLKKTKASHGAWIGLTDRTKEGSYRWYGTYTSPTFSDWGPGQPDNLGNEDCVGIWESIDYRWNDFKCDSYKLKPLCEKKST
ncbi:perlucin-like protein [Mercenaria mercenaria]|uniref:perlucin-like protein n=1 Tax=Mercenaria mercenaria TaxID=6596 RepID=UPI00234F661C|nr:perlucin-like protein [Mercenaria mercenaria]